MENRGTREGILKVNRSSNGLRGITRTCIVLLCMTMLGCASQSLEEAGAAAKSKYSLLRSPNYIEADSDDATVIQEREIVIPEHKISRIPIPEYAEPDISIKQQALADQLTGDPIVAKFRNMPLPEFIQEVFAEQLGLSYVLDPRLNNSKDLVTLNLTEPLPPADLYRTARSVLAEYGVAVVYSDNILKFRIDKDALSADVPLLVSGRALPDVPPTHRPVFTLVPLKVVRNTQVIGWIKQLYRSTTLSMDADAERNAILLKGPIDLVREAQAAIAILDQPLLKGRFSRSFTPGYLSASKLAKDLVKVLTTEGYAASMSPPYGSIIILPMENQQRLLIFASSDAALEHTLEWAVELDSREQVKVSDGFFTYQARNVTAKHIAQLLGALHGQDTDQDTLRERQANPMGQSRQGARQPVIGVQSYMGGKLVVDNNRNVLFFRGSGQEWKDLKILIKEVDKPVPMVLIEVLLAEVTLSDQENTGVEWLFTGDGIDGTNLTASTQGGLGLGGSGLSLTFDSAGETRAILNAFYRRDRAVIRSSPKLLVKSGETAFIEVGNEIPIITSNSQSTTGGAGTPVIQTIQYRKTGVLLTISPIVQASGMVDLIISQELSEEQVTSASSTGSPIILNRKLETTLSLHDGGSVLLGGLISSSKSEGRQAVPYLGAIPFLGRLFRTDSVKEDRTELLMLVTVYVIQSHAEAVDLTNILKQRLDSSVTP